MTKKKNIWSLLDVPDNAKDKAKKLSKESKKNIGEWVGDLILGLDGTNTDGNLYMNACISQPFDRAEIIMIEKEYLDSVHTKLDDLTKQLASIAVQIYDLKINNKFEKKSFWSRFL